MSAREAVGSVVYYFREPLMAQFVLLLYETPSTYAKMSPEEIQQVIEKYNAWSGKMGAAGKLAGGQKLMEEGGRHVRRKGSQLSAVDGPYSETKEVIGGYFIIQAANYDEAVKLVGDCPALDYGWIEIRQVDPMDGGQG
jgi:hypothetical protein